MEAVGQRVECQWCRAQNPVGSQSCATCGAPLDVRNLVSDSGWREAPRLRDMTEFHFGSSSCQVEGELVPVAEITLSPQDGIFFEHHVMLWKEETVPVSVMSLQGMMKRSFAGMPHIVTIARGPGRIAFSRDATGELVVLPLAPNMELDVREHAFLLASHTVQYSYTKVQGLRTALFGGTGMFMDRFVAAQPGLLILHGYGNVFERQLAAGQSILLEPGAYLYKDSSVQMTVETQKLTSGMFGGQGMHLVRMAGPGRVGIQSMYVHHQTE
ncbi:MAG: AIM24 family protein [Candidatus Dormiibacterota bacterium]